MQYAIPEDARRVVAELNGKLLGGRKLQVCMRASHVRAHACVRVCACVRQQSSKGCHRRVAQLHRSCSLCECSLGHARQACAACYVPLPFGGLCFGSVAVLSGCGQCLL